MKRSIFIRVWSMLLCTVMLIGILPATNVHADYEDGQDCWMCDHYHWDDYCCGTCGACSEECTNGSCYLATHCSECGACDKLADDCPECLSCEDCYVNNGWHCLGCNECHYVSEDELCGFCWFCADCMGGLCDSCGFCEGCWEVENMHCPECGNCYSSYSECFSGYDHCEECCIICEQCEECLYEDGIELCDDCGFCELCCLDNAVSEGCDCGEYCTENPDWYDHLCPDCGIAFCEVEMCELCELCMDCCENNSECNDSPAICVEDSDYEFHFCEDCGDCFHNTDACEDCSDAGVQLCRSCCETRLEAEGCDCSDRCSSDSDLDAHLASVHFNVNGTHTATPKNSWELDDNYHWHACRFCDDASHYKNKAAHVYDKYGICTVCKFDSQQNILILKQPQSVVAKVSDIQTALDDDPLYPTNNLRSFTVAAKGTSKLTYQWYVSYNGGTWNPLKDDSLPLVSGANTNKLTLSVPTDGCVYQPAYKCVITDENGNQVTSNVAYMKIQHAYREYYASRGDHSNTIVQPGTGNNIPVYDSQGHYVNCVGEECEADKIEPHSYSKQTRIITDSKSGQRWVERTCIHCGFKSYILDHIHYFYDPVTFECEIDTTYKNSSMHRLKCLWPGCNKTTLEEHNELGWEYHSTPYSNVDKVGVPYKECDICGYDTAKKLQTYNESKNEMVDSQWTQSTDLVFVKYGYSSCETVVNGTKLVIGFAPSEYAKKNILKIDYPTVVGWNVRYYCDRSPSGSVVDMDVTSYFTFTKVGDELKWSLTVPLFAGRTGGGILTFTPIVTPCNHDSGFRIKNASAPICTTDGYTGDTVCSGCDGILFYGETIESYGKHQGNLTLIEGTAKTGSCEQRGYEGTYLCDHCNKKVRGKSTPKEHSGKTTLLNAVAVTCTEFGYSGDLYCECGVLLQEGELLAPRHTDLRLINADKSSCLKKGYTGDWKCFTCNQITKYGYNIASGDHTWSLWGKVDDVYHRHTCVVNGCGAAELKKHTDANRDLTCDDCGYSWGADSPNIRFLTFNVDVPVIGQKPDYTKFDGTAYYSDGTSAYEKNGVEWFDVTANKRFVPGGVGQEFKEGHVYKVTIHFRTKIGYDFVEEKALSGTINGREAVVEYSSEGSHAGISYTFEALKHEHNIVRINKVSPGCTSAGKQSYYHCSLCGKNYENAAATKEIASIYDWGIIAPLGHIASELKSNSTHHFKMCTRCHTEIPESKYEHSGGTATCTTKAKCDECHAAYGVTGDHQLATEVWGFIDSTGHAHMCLTEGCNYRDNVVPHRSSGAATFDKDEVCLDCGYIITISENHTHTPMGDIKTDGSSHWYVCGCGEIIDKKAHTDTDENGICDTCNSEIKTADEKADAKEGSLLWLWILIGIVEVAIGVLAICLFGLKKKKPSHNQPKEG